MNKNLCSQNDCLASKSEGQVTNKFKQSYKGERTRQVGFPFRNKGIEESPHIVKSSEVYLTVLLALIRFLLNLELIILQQSSDEAYKNAETYLAILILATKEQKITINEVTEKLSAGLTMDS